MTTATLPPLQLALALDVVVDAPTPRERLDLMRQLRAVSLGDVWQSGEYRVERDDVSGTDTVRFLRGAHVRGEWAVTSTGKLRAALDFVAEELIGTGITCGWLKIGALCDDCEDETGSVEPCYDAFEAFLQEDLWARRKANCTRAVTCTSSVGTSLCRGTTRRFLAANTSSVILTGWRRRWTLPATSSSGAKSTVSSPTRSTRLTSGVIRVDAPARKVTSHPKPIRGTSSTRAVKNARTSGNGRRMRSRSGVQCGHTGAALKKRK